MTGMMAAPILIGDDSFICVVVVIYNLKERRLYLHESFLTEKIPEIAASSLVRGSSAASPQSRRSIAKILQRFLNTKLFIVYNQKRMLKQISLSLAAAALLASCSIKENRINCQAPVTVSVSTFDIREEPFSKAQAVSDYDGITAITLAFYSSDGTEEYKSTQLRADSGTYTTFGQFSCALPLGTYTMVVIGNGGDAPITLTSATSATYGESKVQETFVYTQAVTVGDITPINLSATLSRIISRLCIISTDGRPADVASIRYTFAKGGKSFNPTTGLATSDSGFSNTVQPSAQTGAETRTFSNLFLATDEENIDVTVESLDEGGNVLYSKTIQNVPFKRNRATIMTGSLFSVAAGASFSVETSFLDDYTMTF